MIPTQQKMEQALNCTRKADKEDIANYLADLKQLQMTLASYDGSTQMAKLVQLADKITNNNRINALYKTAYHTAKTKQDRAALGMLIEQKRIIRDMVDQARLKAKPTWQGGTYSRLFSVMRFQPTATASQKATAHPEHPFKKPKAKEPDEVENKPKIRPDSTGTR